MDTPFKNNVFLEIFTVLLKFQIFLLFFYTSVLEGDWTSKNEIAQGALHYSSVNVLHTLLTQQEICVYVIIGNGED